ncbi:acyltransferase family protein [uncultured Paraglaciecola sp.]|uniref:acyltransferase family protein n=1 Tax=uncultured Paraglaciecola sp. TaxID=1765024 RepID=UPI0025990D05|nr:acyltransferase family protein [uncultured Paraglaciecola sp.]
MTQEIHVRRYDIDWLRSLAFLLLIFYHVGMYYVFDWGWHIKSVEQSVWLQDVMVWSNQWRMSLLFFISGLATSLVANKMSRWALFKERSSRLLLPLIFGMFVIVAPQVYYEGLNQDLFELGYWNFWLHYINPNTEFLSDHHGPIGLLTWNHLWFLPYLWCYSLILLAVSPWMTQLLNSQLLQALNGKEALAILIVVMLGIWFLLRQGYPVTHDLFNDWYSHGKYFWVFVVGFALDKFPVLWQRLIEGRRGLLIVAFMCYVFIIMDRHQMFQPLAELYTTSNWVRLFYGSIYVTNHWLWILAIVGYAGRYLQFSNRFLNKINQAILPCYILHQSVIIIFAANLAYWVIPAWVEAPLLILLTAFTCWIGYEFINRTKVLKPLFGLK